MAALTKVFNAANASGALTGLDVRGKTSFSSSELFYLLIVHDSIAKAIESTATTAVAPSPANAASGDVASSPSAINSDASRAASRAITSNAMSPNVACDPLRRALLVPLLRRHRHTCQRTQSSFSAGTIRYHNAAAKKHDGSAADPAGSCAGCDDEGRVEFASHALVASFLKSSRGNDTADASNSGGFTAVDFIVKIARYYGREVAPDAHRNSTDGCTTNNNDDACNSSRNSCPQRDVKCHPPVVFPFDDPIGGRQARDRILSAAPSLGTVALKQAKKLTGDDLLDTLYCFFATLPTVQPAPQNGSSSPSPLPPLADCNELLRMGRELRAKGGFWELPIVRESASVEIAPTADERSGSVDGRTCNESKCIEMSNTICVNPFFLEAAACYTLPQAATSQSLRPNDKTDETAATQNSFTQLHYPAAQTNNGISFETFVILFSYGGRFVRIYDQFRNIGGHDRYPRTVMRIMASRWPKKVLESESSPTQSPNHSPQSHTPSCGPEKVSGGGCAKNDNDACQSSYEVASRAASLSRFHEIFSVANSSDQLVTAHLTFYDFFVTVSKFFDSCPKMDAWIEGGFIPKGMVSLYDLFNRIPRAKTVTSPEQGTN